MALAFFNANALRGQRAKNYFKRKYPYQLPLTPLFVGIANEPQSK